MRQRFTPAAHSTRRFKKAVFSHIPLADRLGCIDFDSLVAKRSRSTRAEVKRLRQALHDINVEVVELEKSIGADRVKEAEDQVAQKRLEMESHRGGKPEEVPRPDDAGVVEEQIDSLRTSEAELLQRAEESRMHLLQRKQQLQVVRDARDAIRSAQAAWGQRLRQVQQDLDAQGIVLDVSSIAAVEVDMTRFGELEKQIASDSVRLEQLLDESAGGSLAQEVERISRQKLDLQAQLEEANLGYQRYREALRQWQENLDLMIGSHEIPHSLRGLEARERELKEELPDQLRARESDREELCGEIHDRQLDLTRVLDELTEPVRTHIQSELAVADKYQVEFEVEVSQEGLADQLFRLIRQDMGTFSPIDDGARRLDDLIGSCDMGSREDVVRFVKSVVDRIRKDHRHSPPRASSMGRKRLKKGATWEQVYDLLYGLEFLHAKYALALNGKPLARLSPGERGILLLVFYLLVDKEDIPLIIDQPEGNLNNQSIFEHLVPVFRIAKDHRQVIVVTHNPNLAVVCDAEQIIHATIDVADGYRVEYVSGALENSKFNLLSLDLLEGTSEAFSARMLTYDPYRPGG